MLNYAQYEGFSNSENDPSGLKDPRGLQRTSSLFRESITYEIKKKGKLKPIYNLGDTERDDLPSAYLIYMNSIDEYDAAIKIVGSLKHWRKLCKLKWFMEGIPGQHEGLESWREDMKLRDASIAKGVLLKAATSGKDSSAARKILDMSVDKPKRPVGRPKHPDQEPENEEDKLDPELEKLHGSLSYDTEDEQET